MQSRTCTKKCLRPQILTKGPVRVKSGQIEKPLSSRDFSPRRPSLDRLSATRIPASIGSLGYFRMG